MHASSLENMIICYERYIARAPQFETDSVVVVDVGGADVNGGYRSVFAAPKFQYLTVDLAEGNGVDVVLEDPYRLPFADGSVDVVLSGQMLEHCEFFWLTFAEMMRVLKPSGYLILIAPSAGPIHRFPVDCYRFYPDAYRALAKYVNCRLIEVWLDERGPWRDLVGVFSKHIIPARKPAEAIMAPAPYDLVHSPPGTEDEERLSGARPYQDVLKALHEGLRPELYLEIGVRHGRSLKLATGRAVGVDPAPEVTETLPPNARVVTMTSDRFFAEAAERELSGRPDLAFVDGMHLFEYALRDFMNVERLSTPDTIVVIDDVFPNHPAQAERDRRTRAWMGDVWKLHQLLAEARPDLFLLPLDTFPSGLLIVAGLDRDNRILWDQYNPLVRRFKAMDSVPPEILSRQGAAQPGGQEIQARIAALATGKRLRPNLVEKLKSVFA